MDRRTEKGFTLMEMLIVIAIVAVLVAVAIPVFASQLDNARRATDEANARSAYAAAVAEYLSDGATGRVWYVFDAASGSVREDSSSSVAGYGEWGQAADYEVGGVAVTGIANDGAAKAVSVRVADGEVVSVRWGGNDLTTSEGRRQEDIDNMHSIAAALSKAFEDGTLHFQKNYVQVAVFRDGTMAYFNDRWSGDSDDQTIIDALKAAGLSTDYTDLNSDDATWKNGYVVHFDKDGNVKYKAISDKENETHSIAWGWWNKGDMTDDDLVG